RLVLERRRCQTGGRAAGIEVAPRPVDVLLVLKRTGLHPGGLQRAEDECPQRLQRRAVLLELVAAERREGFTRAPGGEPVNEPHQTASEYQPSYPPDQQPKD